jgi:hypothetical protein
MGLCEDLGVGRVGDLAVERDYASVGGTDRGECFAVGQPRRHLFADLPRRQLGRASSGRLLDVALRLPLLDPNVAFAAELCDRRLGVVQCLAVESVLVLDGGDALALDRARDDDRRLSLRLDRLRVGAVDRLDVVPVDLDRVPAERLGAPDVDVGVPADHRLAALPEPVDVEDGREVVEVVMGRVLVGLPDRPFGHLAVAMEHPDPGRRALEVLGAERHADTQRQALPERAGGHVHPRNPGRRVSLEDGAVLTVGQQLGVVDRTDGAEDRVEERRGVALREDQPVVAQVVGVVPVVAEVLRDQNRHQVGGRHARGGMPGLRGSSRADRIDPELLAELAPDVDVAHRCNVTIWSCGLP